MNFISSLTTSGVFRWIVARSNCRSTAHVTLCWSATLPKKTSFLNWIIFTLKFFSKILVLKTHKEQLTHSWKSWRRCMNRYHGQLVKCSEWWRLWFRFCERRATHCTWFSRSSWRNVIDLEFRRLKTDEIRVLWYDIKIIWCALSNLISSDYFDLLTEFKSV